MIENAILAEHVSLKLGDNEILRDVSCRVPRGESTAIVGPNGAGKTSFTLAVLGQVPFKGRISFPFSASSSRPRFGFVPQKLQFDRDMPMTVLDFLISGLQRLPLFFGYRRKYVSLAESMLEEVEAVHLSTRSFGALSGGEIQRVLLAQALLQEPEILVLDEPTAGVDFKGGQICCELLRRIRAKRGFTQLMISHDLATVAAHSTHVICLNRTVVAEGAPRSVLTHDVLSETFGLHLGIPDIHDLPAGARLCDETCSHYHERGIGSESLPEACSCAHCSTEHHHAEDEK